MSGLARHAFLGGNTPQGFFSYFDHLIRPEAARRLFIIKGGPGSGKSRFMRAIGERMQAEGHEVEYFHCSSDVDSLDAIRVPALELAWVDGTAPHIIDPKYPGVIDELVDFSVYCNDRLLRDKKAEILAIQAEVSRGFQRAFCYLRAAKNVHENISEANKAAVDHGRHNERTENLIALILGNRTVSNVTGYRRRLFAGAITPTGPQHYLPTLVNRLQKRFVITGEPGTGKSTMLARLADAALAHGYRTEVYHSPLDPSAIDHIIIPDLDVAVITSAEPYFYEDASARLINLNELREYQMVKRHEQMNSEARAMFRELLRLAVNALSQAKAVRDGLERFYVEAMDFAGLEALREKQIARALQ